MSKFGGGGLAAKAAPVKQLGAVAPEAADTEVRFVCEAVIAPPKQQRKYASHASIFHTLDQTKPFSCRVSAMFFVYLD